MTLVAAWREGHTLHLASDSRLSFPQQGSADTGLKVQPLPLRIFLPEPSNKPFHDGSIGVGLVGSFVSTVSVKDPLMTLLGNLQFAPGYMNPSLEEVAKVVACLLKNVGGEVCKVMDYRGTGQVILVGKCPQKREQQCFSISLKPIDNHLEAEIKQELHDVEVSFFGDREALEAATKELGHQAPTSINVLRALKSICLDECYCSVGGPIQYGRTENDRFFQKGVRDYFLDTERKKIRVGFFIGGIELYSQKYMRDGTPLHLHTTSICPFEKEISDYLKSGEFALITD